MTISVFFFNVTSIHSSTIAVSPFLVPTITGEKTLLRKALREGQVRDTCHLARLGLTRHQRHLKKDHLSLSLYRDQT